MVRYAAVNVTDEVLASPELLQAYTDKLGYAMQAEVGDGSAVRVWPLSVEPVGSDGQRLVLRWRTEDRE